MISSLLSSALATVGVTPERVERWVGRPCGCKERAEKIDQLEAWARRIAAGKLSQAKEYLEGIIGV